MTLQVLGEQEDLLGFTCHGSPDAPELVSAMIQVIEAIGMTVDGPPDVAHYPNMKGNGGVGCQIYQKLTDSWLICGTWPVLNKTRVVLSSCKPFHREMVISMMEEFIGPRLPEAGGSFSY
jgi:hypothetical protein